MIATSSTVLLYVALQRGSVVKGPAETTQSSGSSGQGVRFVQVGLCRCLLIRVLRFCVTYGLKQVLHEKTYQHRPQTVWAECAEKLQALLLSNCTLRYLVLMAVAHMTCYQHFISKTSMVHARFENQTLCEANRGPALSLLGPRRSLCRALCVAARRSLCRGSALFMSGPSAPRRSLSGSLS